MLVPEPTLNPEGSVPLVFSVRWFQVTPASTDFSSTSTPSFSAAILSTVAPAPMLMSSSCQVEKPGISMSSTYVPGGNARNRSCPLSFVVTVTGPPMRAGELTRTIAPGSTPPCASLTVPINAPVNPCAPSA